MGARNVKAVYALWPHLPGKPFQLLAYMALRAKDQAEPRWYGGRDELAVALGYGDDPTGQAADRAVGRALTPLLHAGALRYAVRPGPNRRAEYVLVTSLDHMTETVHRSDDDRRSNAGRKPSTTEAAAVDGADDGFRSNGRRKPSSAAPPTPISGFEQELGTYVGRRPQLRALTGGGRVPRKPDQPALWPSPVGDATPSPEPEQTTAQTIVGEWIEHCRSRPPGRVIGQVAKHIREMLAEGIDPDDIRRGTAAWMSKGLHPAALPSVVNEVMNRGSRPRQSTTDRKVADALALARRLQAEADAASVKQVSAS